jgi:hypothetical protein
MKKLLCLITLLVVCQPSFGDFNSTVYDSGFDKNMNISCYKLDKSTAACRICKNGPRFGGGIHRCSLNMKVYNDFDDSKRNNERFSIKGGDCIQFVSSIYRLTGVYATANCY